MRNRATALIRDLLTQRARAYASFTEVERQERLFYLEYLREGMTVFDVGAHVGELTLMFSRFIGSEGCVHAFEPSSVCFDRLQTICNAASLPNARINQLALSDREDPITLHLYGENYLSWTSQALRPLEDYGIQVKAVGTEEATATTIDAYCLKNNVTSIDLLKIDVEGAEFQVMLGARAMLERQLVRCIAFEFGQTTFDMHNTPEEIESYLKRMGYVVRNLVKSDPVFPGGESARTACFAMHLATPS